MTNCRICHNLLPPHQTFCSECGARRGSERRRGRAKESLFARVKSFLKELFRSEQEKEAERDLEAGFNLGQYGFEAAVPEHEEAVRLNPQDPHYRSVLATTYAGAGNERLGIIGIGGPLWKLMSLSFGGELKAKEILSWVSKLREDETYEAYKGLDKALDGALEMYDESCGVDPTNPRGYSARARAFSRVADGILMAHGIFPRPSKHVKGKLVQHGNAQLGICVREKMPDLQFAVEILWLYERAEVGYEAALRLDPTDTESYVGLSHIQQKLGKLSEATTHLNKALAILNKAIQADNGDEQSYSERAEIFEELGELEPAISDLQRVLALSTWEFKVDATRRRIEELRKRKEEPRKE